MAIYNERHEIRKHVERTSVFTVETYSLLWDICERYFENIAGRFRISVRTVMFVAVWIGKSSAKICAFRFPTWFGTPTAD
jgi:hypothetical protein